MNFTKLTLVCSFSPVSGVVVPREMGLLLINAPDFFLQLFQQTINALFTTLAYLVLLKMGQ